MKKYLSLFVALVTCATMWADYYMAGNGSASNNWCCGINWSADGCAMTDGAYSTKVPAGTYEFKITEGDWAVSYGYSNVDASASTPGYEGSDNVKFTVTAEANINVLFDGMYIVLTSDVPFGSVTVSSWTIAGDEALLGTKWDPADTNNDMQLIGGAYQLVKTAVQLSEGGYDYKACANHAWGIKEVPASGNQTLQIDDAGTYTVTFSLDAQGTTLSAIAELETPAAKDTLTLYAGSWANDGAKIAAWTWTGQETGKWTAFFAGENNVLTAEIPESDTNIKFVRFANTVAAPDWEADIWNEGGDDTINPCLVYYANGYGEGDPTPLVGQWCDEPTALQVIKTGSTSSKFLNNGQLYILHDGKTFNAQGAVVE